MPMRRIREPAPSRAVRTARGRNALKSSRARVRGCRGLEGVTPIEALEGRQLLAAPMAAPPPPPPAPLLNPLTVPKFVNALPNALVDGFKYPSTLVGGVPNYAVGMYGIEADVGLGLLDPVTGLPVKTKMFGYGTSPAEASYPGRTFEVQKDQMVQVTWTNNLPSTHVVPIDHTLLDPMQMYDPVTNQFPTNVPAVPHLHGGHTAADSDGIPLQWFTGDGVSPGTSKGTEFQDNVFNYYNDQEASTLWYHDHAMGVTRLTAYAGMAGFYIIRDPADTGKWNNPLGLPATDSSVGAEYEIPIAIQDKQFTASGQLFYASAPTLDANGNVVTQTGALPEVFGDTIVVNGKAWPKLDVEPRKYRLRLLNGSDSRFYNLLLSNGGIITQIGGDGGLLNAPVPLTQLVLEPGGRADVIIDFAGLAGQQIILRNNAKAPFPKGVSVDARTTGQIMAFNVIKPLNAAVPDNPLPVALRGPTAPAGAIAQTVPVLTPSPGAPGSPGVPAQQLALYEGLDQYGRITPRLGTTAGGPTDFMVDVGGAMIPIIETVVQNGTTQAWDIFNVTPDGHPIHLHLVQFQVVGRQKFTFTPLPNGGFVPTLRGALVAPKANEAGWEDTVTMLPGEMTRVIARFATPDGQGAQRDAAGNLILNGAGQYVWHCHILSHEEHDMMKEYIVEGNLAPGTDTRSQPQVTYNPVAPPVAALLAAPATSAGASVFATTPIVAVAPPEAVLEDTVGGDALADLLA